MILNVSGVDIWLESGFVSSGLPGLKAKGDRILLKFRLRLFDLRKSLDEESLIYCTHIFVAFVLNRIQI